MLGQGSGEDVPLITHLSSARKWSQKERDLPKKKGAGTAFAMVPTGARAREGFQRRGQGTTPTAQGNRQKAGALGPEESVGWFLGGWEAVVAPSCLKELNPAS